MSGTGLYADDYAADLRRTVATVCRLPLPGPELLELLQELEADAVADQDDGPTFWLVVAHQLHRRGIVTDAAARAVEIIDGGADLASLEARGMSSADVRRRAAVLDGLRATLLSTPPPASTRRLTKPQPLLLRPGEVYAFPVDDRGNVRNPYLPVGAAFEPVAWGCCVVVDAGHALGYLAWYLVAADPSGETDRPTPEHALSLLAGREPGLGTTTRAHLRRMGLEQIGTTTPPRVPRPSERRLVVTAGADVSIANLLSEWRVRESPEVRMRRELDDLAWRSDPLGIGRWRESMVDAYAPWVAAVEETGGHVSSAADLRALLTVRLGGSGVDAGALARYADDAWGLMVRRRDRRP